MLINLAFIKTINGLFYFTLDYIAALEDVTSAILVRTLEQAETLGQRFPGVTIRVVGPLQAARAVRAASRHGEMVFTPSSHPIPGVDRQLVVVHDSYPFGGPKGAVKSALFFLALRTSRAAVGYINVSDARAFLQRGGLPARRLHSTPNRLSFAGIDGLKTPLTITGRPIVGLFGTDSPKKNYDQLFAAVSSHPAPERIRFRLYGRSNPYIDGVIAAFPKLDIALTDSQQVELDAFVRSVDIVASAATREGFSRPMALALSFGIPCWIVDAPVFREFYEHAACFYADAAALGAALASLAPGMIVDRPAFTMPARLEREFRESVDWLRTQDFATP